MMSLLEYRSINHTASSSNLVSEEIFTLVDIVDARVANVSERRALVVHARSLTTLALFFATCARDARSCRFSAVGIDWWV